MLGSSPIVAFVGARDSDKAKRFYGDTLGLRLVAEEPYALVFDAAGVMLRVAIVQEVVVAPYTVLGWGVRDVAAVARALASSGVAAELYPDLEQDDLGIWRAPSGTRVLWFKDPEGNTLNVTQF